MKHCLFYFILFLATSLEGHQRSQDAVESFYRLNHTKQTFEFVLQQKERFIPPHRIKMGIWDAIKLVDTLEDVSKISQPHPASYYFFRTAEALRRDDQPRWLILTGLIYDLGKVLAFFSEDSWAVFGETFPVGCAFSDLICYAPLFSYNPNKHNSRMQTLMGIYTPYCGLSSVHMSWGQNEYLYHILKSYLPEEASFIIRYRSFNALRKGGYRHLLNGKDKENLRWLTLFHEYVKKGADAIEDLDSVSQKPYYESLVSEFIPPVIDW